MKKTVSLLFALITVLSLVSCASSLPSQEPEKTQQATAEEKKTEAVTEEKETEEPLPTGEITYPQGFSVGYNRQSIAPEAFPIQTYLQFDHVGKSNHDPCQVTCTLAQATEYIFAKGVEKAYALDGGQTSSMVFNGELVNRVDWGNERTMSDIIYFASAVPEGGNAE
jgi:hypothetical protein